MLDTFLFCSDMKKSPTFADRGLRGLYWTRTSDPIDVNDVLWASGKDHNNVLIHEHS